MKAFAQLPTPTIATRTLPSSISWPFPWAPLCDPLSVGMGRMSSSQRGGACYYASLASGLQLRNVQSHELAAHVPDPLDNGHRREHRHSVDGGCQQLNVDHAGSLCEHEPDRKQDYPHRTRCNP